MEKIKKTPGQIWLEERKNKAKEIIGLLNGLTYSEAEGCLEETHKLLKSRSIIQKTG